MIRNVSRRELNVDKRILNLLGISYTQKHVPIPFTGHELYHKRRLSFWSSNSGNKERTYDVIEPSILPTNHAISTEKTVSSIPSHIKLPEYAITSIPKKDTNPNIKHGENNMKNWNEDEIKCIRQACRIAKTVLRDLANVISFHSKLISTTSKEPKYKNMNNQKVLTTNDLNQKAHEMIISANAYPSALNFNGFPKSISTSVNNVAAHGVPDDRPLQSGDIITVDIAVYYNGYHGDCAETFIFGEGCDMEGYHLVNSSKECLFAAIAACAPGAPFQAIGHSVSKFSKRRGVKVIPHLCGHGIGTLFHMGYDIYHTRNMNIIGMQPGNVFTIEPHVTEGFTSVEQSGNDGYSIVTRDDARVSVFEHTILVTEFGIDILTI